MKLIAAISFSNPPGFELVLKDDKGECAHLPKLDADGNQTKDDKGALEFYRQHIHKGAIVTIGEGETFGELTEQKAALAKIQQLSHCLVPMIDANKGIVARIQKEVAADKKRSEQDAARAKAAAAANITVADFVKKLPDMIAAAVKAAMEGAKTAK